MSTDKGEDMPVKRRKTMEPEVDEGLYSRQVYVLGLAAMKKMSSTRVLIVGMTGLGCEIAKNLILAGVASVTINDTNNLTWNDLSSHFYVSEDDIGKNRATVTLPKLIELNKYVQVNELQGKVTEEQVKNFEVVVFVDQCTSNLTHISQFCHENGIKFIATESRGVAGMAFCDFGKKFEIYDTDGEEVVTCLVSGVTSSNPALITVHDDHRHNLEDGQKVLITDIEGIPELNDKEWEVKVTGPFAFTIEFDATNVNYVRGGYVKPLKLTAIKDYLPLGEALQKPEFMITDFGKMEMSIQLHILFQALHSFIASHGSPPAPYDESQAKEVLEIAKGIAQEKYPDVGELKLDTLLNIARTSAGNLNPMAAFLGGFVAQEVLKASSGKFSPLNQFMYFDAVEVLPTTPPTDSSPRGCRYDGQIAVFGSQFQDLLLKNKNFLVGAGALGCEFLKNFAMMGLGASPEGQVIVTDLDNIEKSNLSRQFLFRPHHIGSAKSEVAASQARTMNPNFNVKFMTDKVAPETEHLFDDAFWEQLDGVTNALDNVQARLYVDSKCVYYRKPLMESGTLGAKANVQVVSPYQTEPYGASRDPPEKQIPICTLKNFPNAIEHTIQWARDAFEGLFKQSADDVNGYLTRSDFLAQLEKEPATRVTTLESIYDALVKNKPTSREDCVRWARFKFEEFFNHQIHQLLYNFPVDTITSSGERFWSGPKRPPTPIVFDPSDPAHIDFIIAASYLRAENYGIQLDGLDIVDVAAHVKVPDFTPKKAIIQTEENENKPAEVDTSDNGKNLDIIGSLPAPNTIQFKMKVIEFEKDDDTNHHIDFITACSNLRARNYKIPEADRSRTKLIAGKIIPAMVTTTALITGIACFEWYKILQKKPLESLRNAFVNLALPFTAFSEPVPAKKNKYGDTEWTVWDRFEVNFGKDVTLKEFIDYFQEKHKLEINMISCGASILFSFFGAKAKTQERLKKPLSEVVKEITKSEFSPSQRYINMEICCVLDDEDVDVPYVRYAFRH
eukprot:NODE_209_length_3229_cov_21.355119_g181_i1.p1 GENE.NODE_209_length_3229_cov_21.355119_g181_i1~~NODE_209_length_3229_cov_21.355119_g181_i1.p1  ORF type:complete len:1014 (+),score=212.75 NODE_209_length_3229_cov_21.355119_g181_i1:54-3095(+)